MGRVNGDGDLKESVDGGGKSFNPFRMWGGWVGAGVGLISIISLYIVNSYEFSSRVLVWFWLFPGTTTGSGGLCNITSWCGGDIVGYVITTYVIGFPLQIIVGFLLGWGIHFLIRVLAVRL